MTNREAVQKYLAKAEHAVNEFQREASHLDVRQSYWIGFAMFATSAVCAALFVVADEIKEHQR